MTTIGKSIRDGKENLVCTFPDSDVGGSGGGGVCVCKYERKKICALDPKVMPHLLKIKGSSTVKQVSTAQMYLVQQVNT